MPSGPHTGLLLPRRRHLLQRALTLAGAARLVPAALALLSPRFALAAEANPPAEAQCLADGVWLMPGANSAPDRANLGRVGNAGFIIGTEGVALIDTGSSRARANELLAMVRKVTALPLKVVLITHPAQEFLFGASLFADLGIPVLAHPATPRLMAERCQHCLDTLVAELGAERMAGTRLQLPTALDPALSSIDLGERMIRLLPGPSGAVPGNLRILDPRSGVLFAGALLSVRRVPAVQDTRPPDWLHALAGLLDDPALAQVVPAYGPVAYRRPAAGQLSIESAVAGLGGYLQALEARTRDLYAAATPLAELGSQAALDAFRDWNGYPANHLHNIFYRYLQLEAEDLASQ